MLPSDQDPAEGSPPRFHGLNTRRFASNPVERQVAELWSAREGKGQLKKLLHDMEPSDRERAVAATVIQWLGSPVGQGFVRALAAIPGFDAAPEGSLTFTKEQVQMLRQLLGNTQLRVSMKGADLERCRKGNPLGRVLLSQWPTEKMHPFMAKVRQLLANSEKLVSDLPEIKEKPAALLLKECRAAMGAVFTGYKGGEYQMGKSTPLWVASYGCCGKKLMAINDDGTLQLAEDD